MRLSDAKTEAEVAAFFRENGERIRRAMAEKAQRGELTGPLPLGYRYEKEGVKKKVTLDPEKAPLVREAFRMAAAGYPIRRIIREITALGLTSIHEKPLGPSSMLKLLRNGFYAGSIKASGASGSGSQPPLIDFTTFALAQKNLSAKRRSPGHQIVLTK